MCNLRKFPQGTRHARVQSVDPSSLRTFGLHVLACPLCGGRPRVVALIDQASVIQRQLRLLGLPTDMHEQRPARAPPLTVTRPRISRQTSPNSTPPVKVRRRVGRRAGAQRGLSSPLVDFACDTPFSRRKSTANCPLIRAVEREWGDQGPRRGVMLTAKRS